MYNIQKAGFATRRSFCTAAAWTILTQTTDHRHVTFCLSSYHGVTTADSGCWRQKRSGPYLILHTWIDAALRSSVSLCSVGHSWLFDSFIGATLDESQTSTRSLEQQPLFKGNITTDRISCDSKRFQCYCTWESNGIPHYSTISLRCRL